MKVLKNLGVFGSLSVGKLAADGSFKLDVSGGVQIASGYAGGELRFKYTDVNAASRSWRLGSDVSAYGDFRLQVTTTQAGTTFADVLSVDSTTGGLSVHSGVFGYGAGAGGTASQPGQNGGNQAKNLTVTLNKPSGVITAGNGTLAAGAYVVFQFNNNTIGASDIVDVQVGGGATGSEYEAWVSYRVTGVCLICIRNNSGAAAADAVSVTFAVRKVATS